MASRVVTFHYVLTNAQGAELDSSIGKEPMVYLEGSGQIIPGLEEELKTVAVGDKKKVTVPAKNAYGEVDKELIFDVPRTQFPAGENIEVGMRFRAQMGAGHEDHSPVFTVTAISSEAVSVDGNHPLAGQDLTFDVEVTDVRSATLEEIKHGHAHGPGGHHH